MVNGRPRRVLVQVEHRTVTVDREPASPGDPRPGRSGDEPEQQLSYEGILLSYRQDGAVDHEVWLPMGETPTLAEDEALIAALYTAMRWNGGELPEHLRRT